MYGTKMDRGSSLMAYLMALLTPIRAISPSVALHPHTVDCTAAQQNSRGGPSPAASAITYYLMFMVRFLSLLFTANLIVDFYNMARNAAWDEVGWLKVLCNGDTSTLEKQEKDVLRKWKLTITGTDRILAFQTFWRKLFTIVYGLIRTSATLLRNPTCTGLINTKLRWC